MTNKEVIEILKAAKAEVEWNYPLDYAIALDKAIEIIESTDKYKWHDLRKDPDDLPDKYQDVIAVNDEGVQHIGLVRDANWGNDRKPFIVKEWMKKYCPYDSDVWEITEDGTVVAWRRIEPFKL